MSTPLFPQLWFCIVSILCYIHIKITHKGWYAIDQRKQYQYLFSLYYTLLISIHRGEIVTHKKMNPVYCCLTLLNLKEIILKVWLKHKSHLLSLVEISSRTEDCCAQWEWNSQTIVCLPSSIIIIPRETFCHLLNIAYFTRPEVWSTQW